MIPKTIHYVWVGHNPKSKIIQECIATWKKNLPDFKFVEWNEDTFDMHENKYIEQAYQAKNGPLCPTIFVPKLFMNRAVFIWILMCV